MRVDYTRPPAIDTRDGRVRLTCTPPPGSLFRLGTTRVTCTATDRAGNTRTSTFDVVVERTRGPAADGPVGRPGDGAPPAARVGLRRPPLRHRRERRVSDVIGIAQVDRRRLLGVSRR
ncbi:hypothetical protein GCM10009616_21470 [Microlunatus lacustris]